MAAYKTAYAKPLLSCSTAWLVLPRVLRSVIQSSVPSADSKPEHWTLVADVLQGALSLQQEHRGWHSNKLFTSRVYRLTAIRTAGEPKASPKLTGPKTLISNSVFV